MTTFPTCRTAGDDVIGGGGSGGSGGSGGGRHEPLSTAGGRGGVGGREVEGPGGGGGSLTPYRKLSDTLN